jgi:hypothetical protein
MRRSIYSDVKAVRALNVSTISSSTNTDGTSVGLDQSGQDFRTCAVVLAAGAVTDGTYTAVPQESANGSNGWTDVPAERLQGSAVVSAANGVALMGFTPDPAVAPFVRVRVTSTDVTSGGSISAILLLGSPGKYPAN